MSGNISAIDHVIGKLRDVKKKIKAKSALIKKEKILLSEIERLDHILAGNLDTGAPIHTTFIQKIFQLSKHSLRDWRQEGLPASDNGYYRAEDILLFLRGKWIQAREDGTGSDLEEKIKEEQHRKLFIGNEIKLENLVPIERVENRNVQLLQSMVSLFQYHTKSAAVEVYKAKNAIEAEKILLTKYNDILKIFKEEATKKEWSFENEN